MKLMTLNTHSLVSHSADESAKIVANAVYREDIDLVALQEVNQPSDEKEISTNAPKSLNIAVKNGNYMHKVEKELQKLSQNYNGLWCGFKQSYGKYDEGIGIITRLPIKDVKTVLLSSGTEKEQWKRRCAVGVSTPYGDFFCTHMGWWKDEDEPFDAQWRRLKSAVRNKKTWILGDFNAESHKTNEGYDLVISDGFYDTYNLAENRGSGYTVCEKIDGWEDEKSRRIDYIFCNFPAKIRYSKTIFDGTGYPVISDHFGVVVEVL